MFSPQCQRRLFQPWVLGRPLPQSVYPVRVSVGHRASTGGNRYFEHLWRTGRCLYLYLLLIHVYLYVLIQLLATFLSSKRSCPSLQMQNLRFREVKIVAHSHTAREGQSHFLKVHQTPMMEHCGALSILRGVSRVRGVMLKSHNRVSFTLDTRHASSCFISSPLGAHGETESQSTP